MKTGEGFNFNYFSGVSNMNRKRIIDNLIEMLKIYSPSKREGAYAKYLLSILEDMGATVYLDDGYEEYGGDCPTIIAKFSGGVEGEGITLAAHMDVVEPNAGVSPILEDNLIKTDGTTTLGGDDKAGIASIIETIKVIKEMGIPHVDLFVMLTPCEEVGMLGAKHIDWSKVPKDINPSKKMIIVDNAGRAGIIAHTAPAKYSVEIKFFGKSAHGGIEPERGINSIALASYALANMDIGRIDSMTTSNISTINSTFPSNVVPDLCEVKGEIRGHSEERILEVINTYRASCEKAIGKIGGSFELKCKCEYPMLKPMDNLKFAEEFAEIYESLEIKSELKIIGGGSDGNIFAKKGFNPIIVGVGINNPHTVEEYLDVDELCKTTEALIKYIEIYSYDKD